MRTGHKRYTMMYESDKRNPFSNIGEFTHTWGYANSIKTAKGYIGKCRKAEAEYNPRNFKIYDIDGDIDPATNFVPCVYQEN